MSEVRLNLIDSHQILLGTIHGSIVDACVAALSAEPETIGELEAALTRYIKPTGDAAHQTGPFSSFCSAPEINMPPWDAGVAIIDLASRIVVTESTYSRPDREGEVRYHNGQESTDLVVLYRVSDEWMFLNSIAEYQQANCDRSQKRSRTRLDARTVLYGRPLLEHIVTGVRESSVCSESLKKLRLLERKDEVGPEAPGDVQKHSIDEEEDEARIALASGISAIHALWLTTSRADLEGRSPREVLLARRDVIDFDLHTRMLQWTFQGEGPPCLAKDSFAYRFAGFGTHECVIYYDLVRFLIGSMLDDQPLSDSDAFLDSGNEINRLDRIKNEWLENPQADLGGRVPAILIENERKRLPITLQARDMIVDDNCEICVMSAREVEMGYGPGFWHLDGSHMDEGFAFSFCLTREEWDEENRRRDEFDQEFNRRWKEREERIARGEAPDDDFGQWIDALDAAPSTSAGTDRKDESDQIQ